MEKEVYRPPFFMPLCSVFYRSGAGAIRAVDFHRTGVCIAIEHHRPGSTIKALIQPRERPMRGRFLSLQI